MGFAPQHRFSRGRAAYKLSEAFARKRDGAPILTGPFSGTANWSCPQSWSIFSQCGVWKDCKYVKIEVEFSPSGPSELRSFLPTDKVIKVSKPYLELPDMD
jgi:hypothetical protein